MRHLLAPLFLLTACSSTGVIPTGADTFMVSKRSAQAGFGPPIGAKADIYREANEHCAKQGKAIETIKLDESNSGFAKPAAASLEFRCVATEK